MDVSRLITCIPSLFGFSILRVDTLGFVTFYPLKTNCTQFMLVSRKGSVISKDNIGQPIVITAGWMDVSRGKFHSTSMMPRRMCLILQQLMTGFKDERKIRVSQILEP